jgi:hypothetical protein
LTRICLLILGPTPFAGWWLLRGLLWLVAAAHLSMVFGVWLATLRTLGLRSLRRGPRIFRLSSRAAPVREILVVILLPVLAVSLMSASGFGAGFAARVPWVALALIGASYPALLLVPPAVLVFSSSTDRQVRWVMSLKRFTAGRRVVSMLDTGYVSVRPRVGDILSVMRGRSGTLTDVLRTSDAVEWRQGALELIELSPVVVVDARVCTRALLFEAGAVLGAGGAYKALFVSEDDGTCPLLERLLDEGGARPSDRLSVVKEEELGPLLQALLASADALPRPGRFASPPSTVAEVAGRRIGAARRPATTRPEKACAAELRAPSVRLRLSSCLTPLWRLAAKGAAANIFVSGVVGVWSLWSKAPVEPRRLGAATLPVLLACDWVLSAAVFLLTRPL